MNEDENKGALVATAEKKLQDNEAKPQKKDTLGGTSQDLSADNLPESVTSPDFGKEHLEECKEEEQRRRLWSKLAVWSNEGRKASQLNVKSIARAQKLINRLKRFNESDKQTIIKEIQEVDLSMYLGEITITLCDVSAFKQKDVPSLVEICVQFQIIYANEFGQEFLNCLKKAAETIPCGIRHRTLLKLIIECHLCGLLVGQESFLISCLNDCFETVTTLTKYVSNCRTGGSNAGNANFRELFPGQCLNWIELHHLTTIEGIARKYSQHLFGIGQNNILKGQTRDWSPSVDSANSIKAFEHKNLDHALQNGEVGHSSERTGASNVASKQGIKLEDGGISDETLATYQSSQVITVDFKKTMRSSLEKYLRQKAMALYLIVNEALLEQESLNQQQRLQKVVADAENEARLGQLHALRDRVTAQLESLFSLVEINKKLRFMSVLGSLFKQINERKVSCETQSTPPEIHVKEAEDFPLEFFAKFIVDGFSIIFPRLYAEYSLISCKEHAGRTRLKATETQLASEQTMEPTKPSSIEEEVQWTDSSERAFYEDLCDLKDYIPAPLLGLKTRVQTQLSGDSKDTASGLACDDKEIGEAETSKANEVDDEKIDAEENLSTPIESSTSSAVTLGMSPIDRFVAEFLHFAETCGIIDSTAAATIDGFARAFFLKQLNIKQNRRKLAKGLITTSKTDLHILPAIGRLVAVLGPYCQDLCHLVTAGAKKEFYDCHHENSPYKMEHRIKSVRFLGELCKFKLVPINTILEMITLLADDLNATNIEILCDLLECCGRFIAGTRGADIRFQNILQKITRIKNTKSVPSRVEIYFEEQIVVLEAALQRMKGEMPPVWQRIVKGIATEKTPVMKQFIQHLVWNQVAANWQTEDDFPLNLVKKFRKLHWENPEVVKWVRDAFLQLHYHIDVKGLSNCSQFLAAFTRCQPQFVVSCVDELLERLLVAAEDDFPSQRQRRILEARLLSEFAADKIVDTSLIMDIIHNLLGFTNSCTGFAASHFRVVFDLIKRACTKNSHFLEDPADRALHPLDLCLKLNELPPINPEARFKIFEHSFLDEKTALEKSGTLPNRLAELLFRVNVAESPYRKSDDFFKIKLACVILKGCWSSIVKRSWPWRVELFIVYLLYAVSWKTQTADGKLPLDIVFDVRETLSEISSVHTKRDYTDLYDISVLLASELVQNAKAIVKHFYVISVDADPRGPHSLLASLTAKVPTIPISPVKCTDSITQASPVDMYAVEDDSEEPQSRGEERLGSDVVVDSDDSASEDQLQLPHSQFDRELEALITESVDTMKTSAQYSGLYNKGVFELRLPHHILKNRSVNKSLQQENNAGGEDGNEDVQFTLVTKRGGGGKYMMKSLNASAGSKLATALSKPVSETVDDSVDRQLIKQFVMDHLDRMGAEEQSDAMRRQEYGQRNRSQTHDQRPYMSNSGATAQHIYGVGGYEPFRSTYYQSSSSKQTSRRTTKAKDKPIREARRKTALDKDSEDLC